MPNFVTYLKFFILCQKIINVLLQQIHECEYFEKKIQMSIVVWIFVWISLIMMLWQSVFSINYTFLCFLIIKCKQYNNKISTKKIWLNHYMRTISTSETWLKKNLFEILKESFKIFVNIKSCSNLSKFPNIYMFNHFVAPRTRYLWLTSERTRHFNGFFLTIVSKF